MFICLYVTFDIYSTMYKVIDVCLNKRVSEWMNEWVSEWVIVVEYQVNNISSR